MAALFLTGLTMEPARAETRTLKLFFIHTKEKAEITYKRNGRYDQGGLQKVNRFLRDWRRNEPTKMDPRLLDLVWEAYQRAGGRDYIHVVSAYRSPATNSMLRKRSKGVANKSQHMLGKAMDFYIPGVKLARLRAEALKLQGGGVGYYPTSGSPFVHMDVGSVRHWPRMNRSQLMAVFPDGKTLHVPTDGKPLPGYNQALASYQSRKKGGGGAVSVAQAESRGGFLSALFGGGADEAEESGGEVAVAFAGPDRQASSGKPRQQRADRREEARNEEAEKPAPRQQAVARAEQAEEPAPRNRDSLFSFRRDRNEPAAPLPGVAVGDSRPAAPAVVEQAPEPAPETPETIIAALPSRAVPLPLTAPRPKVEVGPTEPAANAGALALAAEPALGESVANATEAAAAPEVAPEPAVEIALGIPVPSRRPAYAAPGAAQAAVELAALDAADPALPDSAPINALAARPVPGEGERAIASVIADSKPDASPSIAMAALPAPRPSAVAAPVAKGGRVGATPASTRTAILTGGIEKAAPVKTTAKEKRPSARDSRPDPKPVVMPAQPDAARWAFHNEFVINSKRDAVAPSFARALVRAAPQAVYTAGFQQAPAAEDPTRFSGKAVAFLPVAKFSGTN